VLFRVSPVRGESVYTAEYNSKSKMLTVKNRQGSNVASLYVKGYSLNQQIVTDSSQTTIFFTTYYGYNGAYCYLYSYNINTRQYSLLAKLPGGYYSYDIKELYDGSLYLNGWNPSDNIAMFRFGLNDHSLQKIFGQIDCDRTDDQQHQKDHSEYFRHSHRYLLFLQVPVGMSVEMLVRIVFHLAQEMRRGR